MENEPFHKTWERFIGLLTQCPHHKFPLYLVMQFFYDGLTATCQTLVDTAAGGHYGDKTDEELKEIYDMLAMNSQQKTIRGMRATVNEVTAQSDVAKQVADLTRQVSLLLNKNQGNRGQCEYCRMYGHSARACMNVEQPASQYETAHYMGVYGGKKLVKNDPFSNTYNPRWRNHPNFSWREAGAARPMGPLGF